MDRGRAAVAGNDKQTNKQNKKCIITCKPSKDQHGMPVRDELPRLSFKCVSNATRLVRC